MKRTDPSVAAFTLIELMVVIVVLGILSAAILPEMRGTYSDAVLRAASRDLVDVCALAASRAVALQREHRLRLEPGTGRYQLEKKARSVDGALAFVPVREIPGTGGELDRRLRVRIEPNPFEASEASDLSDSREQPDASDLADDAPPQTVVFRSDGTADRATIVLRDPEGFGLALRVNPVTARIRVLPLDRR